MQLAPGHRPFTILYVGPLWSGGTCIQRMNALQELGHTVVGLDTDTDAAKRKKSAIWSRVCNKVLLPVDHAHINRRILGAVSRQAFDILWIDKGLTVRPRTLAKVKNIHPRMKLVSYSPDDMFNRNHQSLYYLSSIPLYDLVVTTKSYNVAEQRTAGAKDVLFVGNAYAPEFHYPMVLTEAEKKELGAPIGFIGSYEKARADAIVALAKTGVSVRLWGDSRWREVAHGSPFLTAETCGLYGDDYRRALNSFDINLCFLRKANRDLQTQRSIEIPACAAFMLAERTNEHLTLFEEGKEAEFFATDEELARKCRYYLSHPEERKRIARAGYARCIRSGYDNANRLRQVIVHLCA